MAGEKKEEPKGKKTEPPKDQDNNEGKEQKIESHFGGPPSHFMVRSDDPLKGIFFGQPAINVPQILGYSGVGVNPEFNISGISLPQFSVTSPIQQLQEDIAQLSVDKKISEDKIAKLSKEINDSKKTSDTLKKDQRKLIEEIAKRNKAMDTLQRKVNIGHILSRVHGEAQKLLLDDKDDTFLKRFELNKRRPAYVVAIDLRRSTELMLKAESPESFAKFITELCNRLWDIIINNFGIFEKFTGDGILSFFPEFYSGDNSGIFAVKAALKCHESFVDLYKKYYSSFIAVLSDVGLGIGIDFGEITMVNLQNTLSIVGVPVVYACRLSGGKRGQTLLNQPAYKAILEKGCSCFNLCETVIEVKHEGPLVAYDVTSNGSEIPEVKPEWLAKVQNSDSNKK